MHDWITGSLKPLYFGNALLTKEYDWSVASALGIEVWGGWAANAIFSFLAFSLQAVLLFFILTGCLIVGAYAQFLYDASASGIKGMFVLPNLESKDKRCGFELHSRFCTAAILFFCASFFVA